MSIGTLPTTILLTWSPVELLFYFHETFLSYRGARLLASLGMDLVFWGGTKCWVGKYEGDVVGNLPPSVLGARFTLWYPIVLWISPFREFM